MKQYLTILLLLLFTTGCTSPTLEKYRKEGRNKSRKFHAILLATKTYEQLAIHQNELELLFNQLVDTMIAARELEKRGDLPALPLDELDRRLSAQVRAEMERLYLIPGCRELMEECQQEALRRLDRAERKG